MASTYTATQLIRELAKRPELTAKAVDILAPIVESRGDASVLDLYEIKLTLIPEAAKQSALLWDMAAIAQGKLDAPGPAWGYALRAFAAAPMASLEQFVEAARVLDQRLAAASALDLAAVDDAENALTFVTVAERLRKQEAKASELQPAPVAVETVTRNRKDPHA